MKNKHVNNKSKSNLVFFLIESTPFRNKKSNEKKITNMSMMWSKITK